MLALWNVLFSYSYLYVHVCSMVVCSCVDVCRYYHTAGVADASEAWRDVFPDTNAALPNILPRGQLHEKQRNANQQQQHHVQQQERSCKERDKRNK